MNPVDAFSQISATGIGAGVSSEAVYAVLDELLKHVPRAYLKNMVDFAGKEARFQ